MGVATKTFKPKYCKESISRIFTATLDSVGIVIVPTEDDDARVASSVIVHFFIHYPFHKRVETVRICGL